MVARNTSSRDLDIFDQSRPMQTLSPNPSKNVVTQEPEDTKPAKSAATPKKSRRPNPTSLSEKGVMETVRGRFSKEVILELETLSLELNRDQIHSSKVIAPTLMRAMVEHTLENFTGDTKAAVIDRLVQILDERALENSKRNKPRDD